MKHSISAFLLAGLLSPAAFCPAQALRPVKINGELFACVELDGFKKTDRGEGIPIAFDFDKRGRAYLLTPAEPAILVTNTKGKLVERRRLTRKDGTQLPRKAFFYDLSVDQQGNTLVLDRNGGWIVFFDAKGRAGETFGHFVYPDRFEIAPDGNILVRDVAEGVVDIFDPKGTFCGAVKDQFLYPFCDSHGDFVRTRVMGMRRGYVWRRGATTTFARVSTIIKLIDKRRKLYETSPLGFDNKDRLYIMAVEAIPDTKDDSLREEVKEHCYIYRFSPDNSLDRIFMIPPFMERYGMLPRSHRLLDDGRIVTFKITKDRYSLIIYNCR